MSRQSAERRAAIKRIVRETRVRTQADLVRLLEAERFACTQATVSRDIGDLGLRKGPDGAYVLAEDLHLQRMMDELVTNVASARNLVVVRTSAGAAQGVAAAMDAAELERTLGTIAGDDTILIIAEDDDAAEGVLTALRRFDSRDSVAKGEGKQ